MPEDVYQGRAGEIALLHQDGRVWLRARRRELRAARSSPAARSCAGETHRGARARDRLRGRARSQATVALYNAARRARRGSAVPQGGRVRGAAARRRRSARSTSRGTRRSTRSSRSAGSPPTRAARVLDADGAPVPGLWAAGRTAASISSPGYSSGTSIGEAMIFGRIAGREAARARPAAETRGGVDGSTTTPTRTRSLVDPYPVYARMRAEEPAYYVEEYDAWFLSRFEDIWRVGPDFQHFSALQGTTPNHLLTKDTPLNLSFASMDPPQHSKYRAQVSEHFKPGAVAKLEAKMPRIVKGLVDDFIERGECDLVQDLAAQVSVRGALAVDGLPLELADTRVRLGERHLPPPRRPPRRHRGGPEGDARHVLHRARPREGGAQEPGEGRRACCRRCSPATSTATRWTTSASRRCSRWC